MVSKKNFNLREKKKAKRNREKLRKERKNVRKICVWLCVNDKTKAKELERFFSFLLCAISHFSQVK